LTDIRVRFAPSPTGFLHIGGLRTALYNYLFAKHHNGTFILRIEDTDRNRYVEGAVDNLLDVLEWAGVIPDEGPRQGGDVGPYFQSERLDLYKKYAQQLLDNGFAYYAFDTPEEIDALRDKAQKEKNVFKYDASVRDGLRNSLNLPEDEVQTLLESGTAHTIRLKIPHDRDFEFTDLVRGSVKFHSSQVDDQVLIKSDGFPTYHLANIVDDHLMNISHIIRGEEWLSSVPKHLYLYECLGWDVPQLAHLPLIFNPDGSKMSKRDIQSLSDLPTGKVDPDVQTYISSGYEKAAIINYISLLGWNPGDDREVMTLQELISDFDIARVNKAAAIFDLQKLNWLNGQHLAQKDVHELTSELKAMVTAEGQSIDDEDYFDQVIELLHSRLHFKKDFLEMSHYFFHEPEAYDPKTVKKRWKADSEKLLLEFLDNISKLDDFEKHSIEEALQQVVAKHEVGAGRLIHPVRLAVSGVGFGPGLYDMLHVLGKDKVMKRIHKAIDILRLNQQ